LGACAFKYNLELASIPEIKIRIQIIGKIEIAY
jgi:hypothetical protein